MPAWKYDLASMERFVADLDTRIENLRKAHAAAGRTASTLLESYSGLAASGFGAAHADWQHTAAANLEEITAFRDHIELCRRNYADALDTNRLMFGRG